ncbi:MAG TPA: helix-turn-helix transcriptional regulator [Micromonospora sp.]
MSTSRLGGIVADTLRRQRELHQLTQQELAELAGVSQAMVTRIERGGRVPSLPMLERLFAALDAQLTIGVEPLDAHLDARIGELGGRPVADRIADSGLDKALDRLGDLPYVLTGCTAALVQGTPVPTDAIEIAVAWSDSARFTEWLTNAYAQRWNAQWQEYGYLRLDPTEPGEHRWRTVVGDIRATMCDELPESIEVRHGDRGYRVVPLAEVEIADPRAAALLRRYRGSRAAGTARDSAG